jgi:hypothetical protein
MVIGCWLLVNGYWLLVIGYWVGILWLLVILPNIQQISNNK